MDQNHKIGARAFPILFLMGVNGGIEDCRHSLEMLADENLL